MGDQEIIIHSRPYIIFFLHDVLCLEHTNPFFAWIYDFTTVDLWCHVNTRYCYCDVIFVLHMQISTWWYSWVKNMEIIDLELKTLQIGHDFQSQGQMTLKI